MLTAAALVSHGRTQLLNETQRLIAQNGVVQGQPRTCSSLLEATHKPNPLSAFVGTTVGLGGLVVADTYARGVTFQDEQLVVFVGSFGALSALLFGAPSAPLGRPCATLLGHTVVILVTMALHYAAALVAEHTGYELPVALEKVLAPALGIATMLAVRTPVHPPAAACVVAMTTNPSMQGPLFLPCVLLGCAWMLSVQLCVARMVRCCTWLCSCHCGDSRCCSCCRREPVSPVAASDVAKAVHQSPLASAGNAHSDGGHVAISIGGADGDVEAASDVTLVDTAASPATLGACTCATSPAASHAPVVGDGSAGGGAGLSDDDKVEVLRWAMPGRTTDELRQMLWETGGELDSLVPSPWSVEAAVTAALFFKSAGGASGRGASTTARHSGQVRGVPLL